MSDFLNFNFFSKDEPKEAPANQVIVNDEMSDNRVVSEKNSLEPDEDFFNSADDSCEVIMYDTDSVCNEEKAGGVTGNDEKKDNNGGNANADEAILTDEVKPKDEDDEESKPEDNANSGDGCKGSAAEIMKMLDSLFVRVEEFQTTIDKQQDIIKSQKRQLEKYHENIFLKVKQELLLDIIDILDGIEMSFEEFDRDFNKDNFVERIDGVRKQVIGVLENHSVIRVQDTKENPNVVSKRQNVIDRETSSDPRLAEAGFEYKTERPGYAMLDTDEAGNPKNILLRPEEVVKVVYRPQCEE
ncbi:MAG: hypothetical protein ACI31F_03365 [Muribaculaceae bacterium]